MTRTLLFNFFIIISISLTPHESAFASQGMVVSEEKLASAVGANILRAGGNAVDAAVAVGYALSVVNPCCGNIGGGGFMLIHLATGKNVFLNFREKAPLQINKSVFLDKTGNVIPDRTTKGYLAIAVPGTVLGLDTALQKYGTMTRQQVMTPAIKLAKEGYKVSQYAAKQFKLFANDFREQPNIAEIFLQHGQTYKAGERLVQTDLANTLQRIAKDGPAVFYHGDIAKSIVNASQKHGGLLTLEDFARYTVEETSPLHCTYRSYDIITAPPPSAGGVGLCEMLNILENFPLNHLGFRNAEGSRYIVEAMRFAFLDRNKLGDPGWIKNPVEEVISKDYAAAISQQIKITRRTHPFKIIIQRELTDTTHYSILDNQGNAVAVTYTLNGFFGARVIADHLGFFLNDEIDDFTVAGGMANKFGLVQSMTNEIQPGKRPLSSMTPTIIMKNNQLYMVLGSPGGPRIITTILLTLLNVIDYGMNIQQAINRPRFHYQVDPDVISTEPLAFSFFTIKQLEWRGYHLKTEGLWGAVEAILIDPLEGKVYGANDIRRPDGAAIGVSS